MHQLNVGRRGPKPWLYIRFCSGSITAVLCCKSSMTLEAMWTKNLEVSRLLNNPTQFGSFSISPRPSVVNRCRGRCTDCPFSRRSSVVLLTFKHSSSTPCRPVSSGTIGVLLRAFDHQIFLQLNSDVNIYLLTNADKLRLKLAIRF